MSKDFGKTVLSLILGNDRFFESAMRIVNKDMFSDPVVSNCVNCIKIYYERYSSNPSMDILVDFINNKLIGSKKYGLGEEAGQEVVELLGTVPPVEKEDEKNLEYYIDKIQDYSMRANIIRAQAQINELLSDPGANVSLAPTIMAEAISSAGISADEDLNYTREDPREIIDMVVSLEEEGTISTGFSYIDEAIGGGMALGDLITIYGPPGVGKSTMMQLMGLNLVRSGYNILYYNLEMNKKKLARRITKTLLGKTEASIVNNQESSVMDLYKRLRYVPVGVVNERNIDKIKETIRGVVVRERTSEEVGSFLSSVMKADPEELNRLSSEFNEHFSHNIVFDHHRKTLYLRKNSDLLLEENRVDDPVGSCILVTPHYDASLNDLEYRVKKYRSSGIKIDAVILDYLDLVVDDNKSRATWDNINVANQRFKKMGTMNRFLSITATQVDSNSRRQMNEGGYLIKGNDSAGWKGRDNASDGVITLNQTPKMKNNNIVIAYVAKARDGSGTGRAIILKTNLNIMRMVQKSYRDNVDDRIFKEMAESDPEDPGNLNKRLDAELGQYKKTVNNDTIEEELEDMLGGTK